MLCTCAVVAQISPLLPPAPTPTTTSLCPGGVTRAFYYRQISHPRMSATCQSSSGKAGTPGQIIILSSQMKLQPFWPSVCVSQGVQPPGCWVACSTQAASMSHQPGNGSNELPDHFGSSLPGPPADSREHCIFHQSSSFGLIFSFRRTFVIN